MGLLNWFSSNKTRKRQKKSTQPPTVPVPGEESLQIIEGRHLRTDVPYFMPQDAEEINRLDLQHLILHQLLQSNYLAPIGSPGALLDVGCGTGRWAVEMAQEFPQARVVGCDIANQRGDLEFTANSQFVQADVLKGLPFADQSFDFTHSRFLFLAVPTLAWPDVLREMVRVTRVGGWIEVVDSQLQMENVGPNVQILVDWLTEFSKRRGIDALLLPDIAAMLRVLGLESMAKRYTSIPIGNWGGRIGSMMHKDALDGVDALKPALISGGVSYADFEQTRAAIPLEYEEMRTALPIFITYGQRVQ